MFNSQLGMVAHTFEPIAQKEEPADLCDLQDSQGYIERLYIRTKKKTPFNAQFGK